MSGTSQQFPLPLPPSGLPIGYGWEERDMSVLSTTTAFNTRMDIRWDMFLGQLCSVVCGQASGAVLQHCHISRDSEPQLWFSLKAHNWILLQAKSLPRHELHDGLLMCSNHNLFFNAYDFFICFFPDVRLIFLYLSLNYSGDPAIQQSHSKAIALDIRDQHAPFPSLPCSSFMRCHAIMEGMPDGGHELEWHGRGEHVSSIGVQDCQP
ncbi:hypothetical protein DFJ58DRAFT_657424 [Suillus subalutaceus]|uniref:uncharacterized protein n=1 Tax=Suillus subalutaceus TaxID=48586 RepID=UPI001B8743AA|nr:uncharacterized protein DFJ58DRAFT_657424 [Suillus subalutaceus]KAG1861497.1 hypothetical protein DFJ58DRAFT_657424 [Suillus subalutaceus]